MAVVAVEPRVRDASTLPGVAASRILRIGGRSPDSDRYPLTEFLHLTSNSLPHCDSNSCFREVSHAHPVRSRCLSADDRRRWSYESCEDRRFRRHIPWTRSNVLLASPSWQQVGGQVNANFGTVATAGDVNGDGFSDVVVGAALYDAGETNEGRVLLYLGTASGLSTSPAWIGEGNQADALFGQSVARRRRRQRGRLRRCDHRRSATTPTVRRARDARTSTSDLRQASRMPRSGTGSATRPAPDSATRSARRET